MSVLLEVILTCNYFKFGEDYYIQQQGTAMGSNVAPTYANIVMADLEERTIYTSHHFGSVLKWWRYIDDVFVIWGGSMTALDELFSYLNTIDRSIKFTMTCSRESLQFLDTLVTIENNRLKTDLFVKVTDRNNLLQYKSQHPNGMLESLPYSQLLRVKRIVDDPNKYQERKFVDGEKILREGVSKKLVEKHMQRVNETERALYRKSLIYKKANEYVCTYDQNRPQIAKIVQKHWSIMQEYYSNIAVFNDVPILSYRCSPNLKDRLVKADSGPREGKYVGRVGCYLCPVIIAHK